MRNRRLMTPRLERFLIASRGRMDRALERLLPPADRGPRPLHQAMRYGALGGGKRLRPAVCVLAFRAAGGRGQRVMPAACAVELIHAFSLVHDDLPCLDNDDLRRGRPTVHRRFGEANALLAGDALLALAFQSVARIRPPAAQVAIAARLARATGSLGMIGGQALEETLGVRPGEAALRAVHLLKTGRLFEAAAGTGALAAGAAPSLVRVLERYGRSLGLAFQIADDLLDADEVAKPTYPQIVGRGTTVRALAAACRAARRAASATGAGSAVQRLLVDLADYVAARGTSAARPSR